MKIKKLMFLVLGVFLLMSTSALASSVINFRNAANFSGAFGLQSFQFTNVGDELTIDLTIDLIATPWDSATTLWWSNPDGIGIQSPYGYEPDEIEGAEVLELHFDQTIIVDRLLLTDLFSENGYLEIGRIDPDTGDPIIVLGQQMLGSSNGELWVDLGTAANFILFSAPGLAFGGTENHEFSVAQMNYSPVPIPSAILLFGSALLGLAGIRRRLKS